MSWIAGCIVKSMLNFIKKLSKMVFQSFTILQSLQQCMRVPVIPHPHQHLVWSVYFSLSYSNRCVVVFHCGFNPHFPSE